MSSLDEKTGCASYGSNFSGGHCSREQTSFESFNNRDPCLISGQPGSSYSRVEATRVSLQKRRVEFSRAGFSSGISCSSNNVTHVSRDDSGVECGTGNEKLRFTNSGITENSLDPFMFQEDDFELPPWELLSGSNTKSSLDGRAVVDGYIDSSNFAPASQQESNNVEYHQSQETSCSSTVDEDKSNLLADCLLTAVKVFAYFESSELLFLQILVKMVVMDLIVLL